MHKEYDFSTGTRGPVIPSPGKTALTIMLDNDIIDFFRVTAEMQGTGYQALINNYLRESMLTYINQKQTKNINLTELTT